MDQKATKRYFQFATEANRDAALRKQADEARALAHKSAMERRERNGLAWAIIAERAAMREVGIKPTRSTVMQRLREQCLADTSMRRGERIQVIAWQRLRYIEAHA